MKRLPGMLAGAAYAVGAMIAIAGGMLVSQGASASVEIDNGEAGILTLTSDLESGWSDDDLEPGDRILWPITTTLGVAEVGELSVAIEHEGVLASHTQGLSLRLEKCSIEWVGDVPACPVGADVILDGDLASIPSGSTFDVGEIGHDDGPYFLATLWLPDVMPTTLQGQDAIVALGFTALGDSASVTVPPSLPRTGVSVLGPTALCIGLVIVGLTLARQRASTRTGSE